MPLLKPERWQLRRPPGALLKFVRTFSIHTTAPSMIFTTELAHVLRPSVKSSGWTRGSEMKNSIDSTCDILALQCEVERLTFEWDATKKIRDILLDEKKDVQVLVDRLISERDKAIAELDDTKQVLSDYKASQNGLMREMHIKTVSRAIKVCEDKMEWASWSENVEGVKACIDALRAEFGLDKG